MPSVRGLPRIACARASSASAGMLLKEPCESFTQTSVAPASKAPAIAAFASAVISAQARSYSGLPGRHCSERNTPATPSMSVEISTFMVSDL